MSERNARASRQRRQERIRRKVRGTPARPRLAVYRSNTGVYAQVIDDSVGHTVAAASSRDSGLELADGEGGKTGQARAVGRLVAERAKAAGVERVVFDRAGRRYHGRVAAVADGARDGGLEL